MCPELNGEPNLNAKNNFKTIISKRLNTNEKNNFIFIAV